MSEVEKMYENAGIKPYIYCSKPQLDCDARENGTCKQDCEYYSGKRTRITFTAEKQLLLIQWLAKTRPIHITFLIDKWVIEGMIRYGKRYDTFEDALSGYINNIWQDLTETERNEIRSILNG